ncbi:MAG TPA: response regulator, partial [Chthonomonadaceae bacterium]|nr:response regulator [Chthonomonadaceae bacterium]
LSEDNPGDVELTRVRLQSAEQVVFTLEAVDEFAATMQRLEAAHFDILLLDLSVLEGRDLRASIEGFKRIANLPVVVLTGQDNEQLGVEAVKAGAEDYLVKGRVDSDLLMRSLRFAVERHRRKHLQDRLHQSQRLEEIGRLAGGVAHDFNNILTAIMGFTELACEAEPGGDDLPNYLGSIGKAAQRAADLTQQLLAFARKQTIQPRVLDLNECVYDMEKMLRRLISPNIVLTTQLAPHLWQVKADPGQMEQVIVNLIVNARDAMPNGGRIEMETANVSLDERGARLQRAIPGDYVLLSVRDTGEGMSAEVQSHIFEPFFTTKEKGKGTGLGLATCYGIIQQNGGIIAVESVPGEGTRFRIYLPCFQEAVIPTRRLSESTVVPSGGETILLIEDEPMVRQMAAQTLRKLGYVIEEAADGAEAIRLAKARNDHFDLVVTDVLMPGMSGKEVADHLLAMHPQTRFLFISGYTDNTIDQQGHLEEGIAFLQKPFTPTTLAQKVRRMLNADNNAVEGMR